MLIATSSTSASGEQRVSGSGPRAVLVGPPGSGKTTVGKQLAARLGVAFRDTDHDIEVVTGSTVSDIFIQQGEEQFRALERDAVKAGLAEHRGVLALGAGAVLSQQVRQMLDGHMVVLLEVGLSDAMRRLQMNRSRPLLVGNVRGRWQELADQRRGLYAEVAGITVATDGRTPAQVVDEVLASLGAQARVPIDGEGQR